MNIASRIKVKDTKEVRSDLTERILMAQQQTAAYTDQRRCAKPPTLLVGDWVRVRRPVRRGKLASRLSAPLQIVEARGATCRLSDGGTWNQLALVPTSARPGSQLDEVDELDPLVDVQAGRAVAGVSGTAGRPPPPPAVTVPGEPSAQATTTPRRSRRLRQPVQRYKGGW